MKTILTHVIESKYQCPLCKEKYLLYHFGTENEWVLKGLEQKSKEYIDIFNKETYYCHSCSNTFTITKLQYVDNNGNII